MILNKARFWDDKTGETQVRLVKDSFNSWTIGHCIVSGFFMTPTNIHEYHVTLCNATNGCCSTYGYIHVLLVCHKCSAICAP